MELNDELSKLESPTKATIGVLGFVKPRCQYPMPDWTNGICGCKYHQEDEHEAIVKRIEDYNKMPFDTTPNKFRFVKKLNPWKGTEEFYTVYNE